MVTDLMIQAEGLQKRYGDTQALAGVSFDVPAGTILGLLGPNGAGKTTAVRILTTLAVPDAGSATVAGIDVVKHPNEVRHHIGVAAQDATLDGLLTGRQNLTLVGELCDMGRRAAKARAAELLEQFELTHAADRVLKGYSGGMRRRLDLAASLMTRPPVLFLDEPTTGLDPTSRQRVWDAIRGLLDEGVTVLADDAVPGGGGRAGRPHRGGEPRAGGGRWDAAGAQGGLQERPGGGDVGHAFGGGRTGHRRVGGRAGARERGRASAVGRRRLVARAGDHPGAGSGCRGSAGGQHRGAAAVIGRRVLHV